MDVDKDAGHIHSTHAYRKTDRQMDRETTGTERGDGGHQDATGGASQHSFLQFGGLGVHCGEGEGTPITLAGSRVGVHTHHVRKRVPFGWIL